MKRLSDYSEDESIVLWGELLTPVQKIIADNAVISAYKSGKSLMEVTGEILKRHPAEAKAIILAIDKEPINAINLPVRLLTILADLLNSSATKSFFESAGQEDAESDYTGSPTENTGAKEN